MITHTHHHPLPPRTHFFWAGGGAAFLRVKSAAEGAAGRARVRGVVDVVARIVACG